MSEVKCHYSSNVGDKESQLLECLVSTKEVFFSASCPQIQWMAVSQIGINLCQSQVFYSWAYILQGFEYLQHITWQKTQSLFLRGKRKPKVRNRVYNGRGYHRRTLCDHKRGVQTSLIELKGILVLLSLNFTAGKTYLRAVAWPIFLTFHAHNSSLKAKSCLTGISNHREYWACWNCHI